MEKELFGAKPEKKQVKEKFSSKDAIMDFKKWLWLEKANPIMAYLEKFDTYFKKKKRILETWDVLFWAWKDLNFYIIASGWVDIIWFTSDWLKKEVWKAYAGSFIWEWIIFWRNQKDVEAVANSKAEIFALTLEDLRKFEQESPAEAIELYKHVIEITNKRLLDSWRELANIYEATWKLVEMSEKWERGFPEIMIFIQNLLWVDYIIYIENHPLIDGLFIYKHNTKMPNFSSLSQRAWKEIHKNMHWMISDNMWILWVHPQDSAYIFPLKYNSKLKWYFIAWKRKWTITDNEMRISMNLWPLIWSIVDNNQKIADQKAKEMSKNYFDKGIA